MTQKRLEHRLYNECCRCGQIDKMECVVEEGAQYLCKKCFKQLKRQFEKDRPGMSLEIKEDIEQ